MILLNEEKVVVTSNDSTLKLTNLRVQYENKEWGKSKNSEHSPKEHFIH